MVVAEPPRPSCVPGQNGRLYPRVGDTVEDWKTNLDRETVKGKALIFNALSPADSVIDGSTKDKDGQPYMLFCARYYMIYPDEFIDPETGVVSHGARTCLIDANSRTFKTTSGHAPHVIQRALDLFGESLWEEGIIFRITERKSRNKQRQSPYHDIRVEVS
jgi:hypothetical protein